MENNEINKECFNHKTLNSNFYCFDDKVFLCDICFKEHKKHNIEVISEIEKQEKIYNNLFKNQSIEESFEEIKTILNELKNDVEQESNKFNSLVLTLKNEPPSPISNSIYNLSFQEYESVEQFSQLIEFTNNIEKKLNKIKKYYYNKKKEYKNFREINKEVDVIDHSKIISDNYSVDVMLGKKSGDYSLFDGPNNHFALIDFKKKYYLKDILISVKQNWGCVLKNLKVSVKNEIGEWELVNTFICRDNNYPEEMQSFPIEKETQFVIINFIDAWSNHGGNCILIKKLSFNIADIIE